MKFNVSPATLAATLTAVLIIIAVAMAEGMNNHWAWFHILEHQVNHMGQIALVKKRLSD